MKFKFQQIGKSTHEIGYQLWLCISKEFCKCQSKQPKAKRNELKMMSKTRQKLSKDKFSVKHNEGGERFKPCFAKKSKQLSVDNDNLFKGDFEIFTDWKIFNENSMKLLNASYNVLHTQRKFTFVRKLCIEIEQRAKVGVSHTISYLNCFHGKSELSRLHLC